MFRSAKQHSQLLMDNFDFHMYSVPLHWAATTVLYLPSLLVAISDRVSQLTMAHRTRLGENFVKSIGSMRLRLHLHELAVVTAKAGEGKKSSPITCIVFPDTWVLSTTVRSWREILMPTDRARAGKMHTANPAFERTRATQDGGSGGMHSNARCAALALTRRHCVGAQSSAHRRTRQERRRRSASINLARAAIRNRTQRVIATL